MPSSTGATSQPANNAQDLTTKDQTNPCEHSILVQAFTPHRVTEREAGGAEPQAKMAAQPPQPPCPKGKRKRANTQPTTRERKCNYTAAEASLINRYIIDHHRELYGTHGHNTTPSQRRHLWQTITDQVNALGNEFRHPHDIQKRWQDTKFRVKRLLSIQREIDAGLRPRQKTKRLTAEEEEIATLIEPEQLEGMGVQDTEYVSDGQEESEEEQPGHSRWPTTRRTVRPASTPPGPAPVQETDEDEDEEYIILQPCSEETGGTPTQPGDRLPGDARSTQPTLYTLLHPPSPPTQQRPDVLVEETEQAESGGAAGGAGGPEDSRSQDSSTSAQTLVDETEAVPGHRPEELPRPRLPRRPPRRLTHSEREELWQQTINQQQAQHQHTLSSIDKNIDSMATWTCMISTQLTAMRKEAQQRQEAANARHDADIARQQEFQQKLLDLQTRQADEQAAYQQQCLVNQQDSLAAMAKLSVSAMAIASAMMMMSGMQQTPTGSGGQHAPNPMQINPVTLEIPVASTSGQGSGQPPPIVPPTDGNSSQSEELVPPTDDEMPDDETLGQDLMGGGANVDSHGHWSVD